MYSRRLYKYRDSYVLHIPTVHTFGTVNLHTLFWYRHTHMTFPPPGPMYKDDLRYTFAMSDVQGWIRYTFAMSDVQGWMRYIFAISDVQGWMRDTSCLYFSYWILCKMIANFCFCRNNERIVQNLTLFKKEK